MKKRPPPSRLWAELERTAHQLVLDLRENDKTLDAEQIADRVLGSRDDVPPSMKDEYRQALVATILKQIELLSEGTRHA